MSLDYIRRTYRVPAHQGGRVRCHGRWGTIVGAADARLRVRLDGEAAAGRYHPTDGVEYAITAAPPAPAAPTVPPLGPLQPAPAGLIDGGPQWSGI